MEKESIEKPETDSDINWDTKPVSEKIKFLQDKSEEIIRDPEKVSDEDIKEVVNKIHGMWGEEGSKDLVDNFRGLEDIRITREVERKLAALRKEEE